MTITKANDISNETTALMDVEEKSGLFYYKAVPKTVVLLHS